MHVERMTIHFQLSVLKKINRANLIDSYFYELQTLMVRWGKKKQIKIASGDRQLVNHRPAAGAP